MFDIIYLLTLAVFFLFCAAYAAACETL